ncbi:MAG: FAD-dependent oxidoreductase [Loktanella sp.]|nr:FAD-dependent oxidoreductase [Loktanella sp.]
MNNHEICVIGAGLSGLALGCALRSAGRDVIVLDARDRAGGRVLSRNGYDLGPSWIWPQNRRMLHLIEKLDLRTFEQFTGGRLVFEDAKGHIRRDLDFATMGGALRVAGGLASVTEALARDLGASLRLSCPVSKVSDDDDSVTVSTASGLIRAGRVVLALPPRLAAAFGTNLPDVPTWMAGHAKVVATYANPFWRSQGLNGDAISHRGPMAEIHDASPADADSGALFGFADPRAAQSAGFQAAMLAQLVRLFGPQAGEPDAVYIKDWSIDPATATKADQTVPAGHPAYQPLSVSARVIMAGSECAPDHGGFLEGALAAAEAAYARLMAA